MGLVGRSGMAGSVLVVRLRVLGQGSFMICIGAYMWNRVRCVCLSGLLSIGLLG